MLRWLFLIRYPDGVDTVEGERWYLGTHTQEAKHLSGLRRYVSWPVQKATVAPPWTTVERLNRWDRVTELVFDDWDAWHGAAIKNVPDYTLAPYGRRGFEMETIFLGDGPTEDFLGTSPTTADLAPGEEARLIRWLFLLRYPETISKEHGEDWYLGTHTQEAKLMHGLRRYVSWAARPVPGELGAVVWQKWDRLTELAFAGWDAWQDGAVSRMPNWTPPPYGNPGFLSETVFIREEPEYDFLRQVPSVP